MHEQSEFCHPQKGMSSGWEATGPVGHSGSGSVLKRKETTDLPLVRKEAFLDFFLFPSCLPSFFLSLSYPSITLNPQSSRENP